MNLYLVLALALGVSAPLPPARLQSPAAVTQRSLRRIAVQFVVRSSQFEVREINREPRTANCELHQAPLTGAASPRAPARS